MRFATRARFAVSLFAVIGLAAPAAAQVTHNVSLTGFEFAPSALTINVGDTVLWTWLDGLHNVESGASGFPDGNFISGAPTIVVGTTYSVVFDAAFLAANPMPGNIYPYYCSVHFGFGMEGTITVFVPVLPETFVRGDCNDDTTFNIADVIFVLGYLFGTGASTLNCDDACDCNDDGSLNVADAIFALSAQFSGGPQPGLPSPLCGLDPTLDALGCANFASCP
ncbi:MAG: plastocyanin/azurin family copper-binding protein [Planctomycetota bacterium]